MNQSSSSEAKDPPLNPGVPTYGRGSEQEGFFAALRMTVFVMFG